MAEIITFSLTDGGERITVKLNENARGPAGNNVSNEAYDATTWNGVTNIAPSKNAVRDKIEAIIAMFTERLDFLGANPNHSTITIVGIVSPASSDPLVLEANDEFSWYFVAGGSEGVWTLARTGDDAWSLTNTGGTFSATATAATDNPQEVTGWVASIGSIDTDLVSTVTALPYDFTWQFCLTPSAWWQIIDGIWIPIRLVTGEPITRRASDTSYYSISVDDFGALAQTPFP